MKKMKFGKPKKWVIALAGIVVALIAALIFACTVLVDYLELQEIGSQYTSVFWINFNVKLFSFLACLVVSVAVLLANTVVLRKNLYNKGGELPLFGKFSVYLIIDCVIALLLSIIMSQMIFDKVLMYLNSTGFNLGDPIFNQDIGYYVFQRPFYSSLLDILSFLFVFAAILTALIYVASYIVNKTGMGRIFAERPVMLHVLINVVFCVIIRCLSFKISSENILYSEFAGLSGAGYTDINVWKNFYKFAPLLIALSIILAFYVIFMKKFSWKRLVAVLLIYPVVFVSVSLAGLSVQRLYVAPNESSVESKHIEYNIQATRNAFQLNDVATQEFSLKNDLTAEDILENSDSIRNLRTIDYNQNLVATSQLQSIRNYYTFKDSDTVVYNMNGQKTALNCAVREINPEKLDGESKKFENRRLRFTHGYGIVMNPLNLLNDQGQPQFVVKDIPTFSYQGAPEISQPRIYFGEMSNDYVIAGSAQQEFDYSEGNVDVETTYTGASGIPMNFWSRLIFSLRFGDLNLMISGYVTPQSKLLTNRNIVDRVTRVAPFLTYDPDPYPVVTSDGRIKWVIDAYTTTDQYPYAAEYNGINYIRNSARAIIDAYDGTVTFYVVDESDPIIQTYRKIYPKLFTSDPLPGDIADKIKYPEYLFKIQSQLFTKYHMTDPTQLYNKTDVWTVAKEKYSNDVKEVEPYYTMMSLAEGQPDELYLMIPYTIKNKDNMVAWLAVQSEGGNFGKLNCITFPAGQNVYGPLQIDNRIDSDSTISKELSLWNQGGSTVIRGNLLVVPLEQSLLYIEPVYITSNTESNLPEMKRVIVSYGNTIVMEPTLQDAFSKLFSVNIEGTINGDSTANGNTEVNVDDTLEQLIDKAVTLYDEVEASMKSGDYSAYGENMQKFSALIKLIKNKRLSEMPAQ